MTFNTKTMVFRIALSLTVVWLTLIAYGGYKAVNSVNYFDYIETTGYDCLPSIPGLENACTEKQVERSPAEARRVYNEARLERVKEALSYGLIPAAVLLALAGFSGSIWVIIERYFAWLRHG